MRTQCVHNAYTWKPKCYNSELQQLMLFRAVKLRKAINWKRPMAFKCGWIPQTLLLVKNTWDNEITPRDLSQSVFTFICKNINEQKSLLRQQASGDKEQYWLAIIDHASFWMITWPLRVQRSRSGKTFFSLATSCYCYLHTDPIQKLV